MTSDAVPLAAQESLWLALQLAGPLLVALLLVGLAVAVVQALTQINEQTLTFIPKLIAVAIVGILALPWMLRNLVEYMTQALNMLPGLAS